MNARYEILSNDHPSGSQDDKFATLDPLELSKNSTFQELRKHVKDEFGLERKFTTKKELIQAIIDHNSSIKDADNDEPDSSSFGEEAYSPRPRASML